MAKGAFITPQIKRIIADVFFHRPDGRAREIQAAVAKRVKELGNGSDWPSMSVVEKELALMRPRLQNIFHETLFLKWNIGASDLSAEANTYVLATQQWALKHNYPNGNPRKALTPREGKWLSRIFDIGKTLIRTAEENSLKRKEQHSVDLLEWLWDWSRAYARYEILCEFSDTLNETSRLDSMMWRRGRPVSENNEVVVYFPDDHMETLLEITKDGKQ